MSGRKVSVVVATMAVGMCLTQGTVGQDSFEYRFAFGTVCG